MMSRPTGIASVMSLNSAEAISFKHQNIDKWLVVDVNWLGLIVQWEEPHPNDEESRLTLFRVDLQKCFEIAVRLKVKHLAFIRVNISTEPHNDSSLKSSSLEEITFVQCKMEFETIRRVVRDCPKLERLTCDATGTVMLDSDLLQDNYLGNLIKIVRQNYRLTKFDYSAFREKIMPDRVHRRFWTTETVKNRKKVISEYAMLQCFIARNLKGRAACYAAIQQIYLIKRFRPKSIFRIINRDAVNIICRLVYESIGTAMWC